MSAGILDFLLLTTMYFAVVVVAIAAQTQPSWVAITLVIVGLLALPTYRFGTSLIWSATPGKLLLGFKVVDESGASASKRQIFRREVRAHLLWVIPLVRFLWLRKITMDENRQGWHDRAARTVVVRTG